MAVLAKSAPQPQPDYASCSGCGLCLLVCPVWRRSRDIGLTPLGRAKALQHGALPADIGESIQSCTLCGACEPACPEEIGLIEMTLGLRRALLRPDLASGPRASTQEQTPRPLAKQPAASTVLLPGQALRRRPATLARAAALLGKKGRVALADDDGADIALELETGATIQAPRLARFLQPLRGCNNIVVADGLLLRHLRRWLPRPRMASLGEALSGLPAVRRALRAGDLYVIEPRAYHADYRRLVTYYDALRADCGCALNLDLQRIAIPATARRLTQPPEHEAIDDLVQARWILRGRNIARIVLENLEDASAFEQVSDCPVLHLADLAFLADPADDGAASG